VYWSATAKVRQRLQRSLSATATFCGVIRLASRLIRLICSATAIVVQSTQEL